MNTNGEVARKRITVLITDNDQEAENTRWWLSTHGIDAKVITKHAAQIHPDHWEKARDLAAARIRRAEGKRMN